MTTLYISLFGHGCVRYGESPPLKLSRSSLSLLAYLLLHPAPVPRELLQEVFWADQPPDRGRSSLATAIWRLRNSLETDSVPVGAYLLAGNGGCVGFNWESDHCLDTDMFRSRVGAFMRKSTSELNESIVGQMEGALSAVHGELLEGVYDDWLVREREHFNLLRTKCLQRLMEYHVARVHPEQAILCAQAILRSEPLREDTHRLLMRLYADSGQRTRAVQQYMQCSQLLATELGISPLEETTALYHQIIGAAPDSSNPATTGAPSTMAQLADELTTLKRSLDNTNRMLDQLVRAVSCLAGDPGRTAQPRRKG